MLGFGAAWRGECRQVQAGAGRCRACKGPLHPLHVRLLDQAGQVQEWVGLLRPEGASTHVLDPGGLARGLTATAEIEMTCLFELGQALPPRLPAKAPGVQPNTVLTLQSSNQVAAQPDLHSTLGGPDNLGPWRPGDTGTAVARFLPGPRPTTRLVTDFPSWSRLTQPTPGQLAPLAPSNKPP